MPRGCKVSRSLTVNMILFTNISNFCKLTIYIMIFGIAHWELEMIILRFSVQGEDIIEHFHGNCHVFRY